MHFSLKCFLWQKCTSLLIMRGALFRVSPPRLAFQSPLLSKQLSRALKSFFFALQHENSIRVGWDFACWCGDIFFFKIQFYKSEIASFDIPPKKTWCGENKESWEGLSFYLSLSRICRFFLRPIYWTELLAVCLTLFVFYRFPSSQTTLSKLWKQTKLTLSYQTKPHKSKSHKFHA